MRRNGNGRLARLGAAIAPGAAPGAGRPQRLPQPPPRPCRRRRPARPPGRSSSPPAGRCSPRSASTTRPGSAPPPRSSSPSTSPRWCRRPRPTSASSSSRSISVLHTGFGVGTADALAYGVILQAVEIATAVALGLPALVREGTTWSDLRVQALSAAPVISSRSRRARRAQRSEREGRPDLAFEHPHDPGQNLLGFIRHLSQVTRDHPVAGSDQDLISPPITVECGPPSHGSRRRRFRPPVFCSAQRKSTSIRTPSRQSV